MIFDDLKREISEYNDSQLAEIVGFLTYLIYHKNKKTNPQVKENASLGIISRFCEGLNIKYELDNRIPDELVAITKYVSDLRTERNPRIKELSIIDGIDIYREEWCAEFSKSILPEAEHNARSLHHFALYNEHIFYSLVRKSETIRTALKKQGIGEESVLEAIKKTHGEPPEQLMVPLKVKQAFSTARENAAKHSLDVIREEDIISAFLNTPGLLSADFISHLGVSLGQMIHDLQRERPETK